MQVFRRKKSDAKFNVNPSNPGGISGPLPLSSPTQPAPLYERFAKLSYEDPSRDASPPRRSSPDKPKLRRKSVVELPPHTQPRPPPNSFNPAIIDQPSRRTSLHTGGDSPRFDIQQDKPLPPPKDSGKLFKREGALCDLIYLILRIDSIRGHSSSIV